MILRPYGLVIDGRLEIGLEVVIDDHGRVDEVRPHTGVPDPYVVSPAFVNAHSHFEYRGLQGEVQESEYFAWIKELTGQKRSQTPQKVVDDCSTAAAENRATGVAIVGEHSDRPGSAQAMEEHGLRGTIFQEVITFTEHADPEPKIEEVRQKLAVSKGAFSGPVHLNPHAPWSVDEATLRMLAKDGGPKSIHVAESIHENAYFHSGNGPIAEIANEYGIVHAQGARVVDYLDNLGYLRAGVQFVHACDLNLTEVEQMASAGVSVAHCPRSNEALSCPRAPVREMLDAGITVGLGLDSAASSGPIDMFAEMSSAMAVSLARGAAVTPEEVWRMATNAGALSLGFKGWGIEVGSDVPLIKLNITNAHSTEDLIAYGAPEKIEWTDTVPS